MMDDFTTDNPSLATLVQERLARNEVNGRTVIGTIDLADAGEGD